MFGGARRWLVPANVLFLGLLAGAPAAAAPLRSSTFDSNDQGWRVSQGGDAPPSAPGYFAAGGNPGGYIEFTDSDPDSSLSQIGGFLSPAGWEGDMSAAYGGIIHFDLKLNGTDGLQSAPPLVAMAGGSTVLGAVAGIRRPGTTWASYSVPIYERDWEHLTASTLLPATKAELMTALGHFDVLIVVGDYRTDSGDKAYLDNVVIEPPTRVARNLTLAHKKHNFKGKLFSSERPCVTDQTVKVFKKETGPDPAVAKGTTQAHGRYLIGKEAKPGNYYAKTPKKLLPGHGLLCLAAKSPGVRVH